MAFGARINYQRTRVKGEEAKVDFAELFFDLVFVFAITQCSHTLLGDLSVDGLVHAAICLLAVWWVWIDTSWVTNWLDPTRPLIRILLFVLMLGSLLLATSIPLAFGVRGWAFALAYVSMQVGRSIFMAWAVRHHDTDNFHNFVRITVWMAVSGVIWIAGGLADGDTRLLLWIIALVIDYISALAYFWTPFLGASRTTDWTVEGGHLAERCGLFIIIALGESIVATGSTFSAITWTVPTFTAFLGAFFGTVAMWWIYFSVSAGQGRHTIEAARDPGQIARTGYTYLHVLIVAGIIVAAVGDELILAHPLGHDASLAIRLTVAGGPALYLFGIIAFQGLVNRRLLNSHNLALAALLMLILIGANTQPLFFGTLTGAILAFLGIWDGFVISRRVGPEVSIDEQNQGGTTR